MMYNFYERMDKIQELMRGETAKTPSAAEFQKIVQTGTCEVFDYGTGLLCLAVYTVNHGGRFCVRLSLSSSDDSSGGAWSQYMSLAKCFKLFDKTVKLVEDIVTLPSLAELNVVLRPVGLYAVVEN